MRRSSPFIVRLRRVFIGGAMLVGALVLAVIVAGTNIVNYVDLSGQADARLAFIAQNDGNPEEVDRAVKRVKTDIGEKQQLKEQGLTPEALYDMRYAVVALDDAGEVLACNVERIPPLDADDIGQIVHAVFASARQQGFFDTMRFRVFDADEIDISWLAGDVDAHGEVSDATSVYLLVDCAHDLTKFESYLGTSVAAAALGLVVVFAFVALLARIVLRPVVESYEKQRRFVTDASHEIKTPLAVIDAADEVLEIDGGQNEWTQSIHHEVARLAALTEQLVVLSRLDEGASRLEMRPFDISEAAAEAAGPYFALAQARGVELSLDIAPHAMCTGDKQALMRAWGLLLDNATRYAASATMIVASVAAGGRAVELSVENAVETMPDGDLDRLFERFFRPDASRSSDTGGSGIGLSIVRAVAEAHRGTATVRARGDTITFTVRIPR